jgi:hypothetical protein
VRHMIMQQKKTPPCSFTGWFQSAKMLPHSDPKGDKKGFS